jgi:ATP-binding cassette subfamily C protein LapB
VVYNHKLELEKDFAWLSSECLIEQLQYSEPSRYEKDQFVKKLDRYDGVVQDKFALEFFDQYLSKYQLQETKWTTSIDDTMLPIVALVPNHGLQVIIEKQSDNRYKTIGKDGTDSFVEFPKGTQFKVLRTKRAQSKISSAKQMFKKIALSQKRFLIYAVIATVSINILALGSSFYTMQVYDRVIPTNGISTLISLTIGVAIAILLEMLLKLSRASIVDQASKNMDIEYSHNIFERFLNIRNDALPKSIGTLSGQLQSYSSVRSFITTASVYFFIDFPFLFMFFAIIVMLGGIEIGMVVLIFLFVALFLGIMFKGKIEQLTKESSMASHKKLGLLVESVESSQKVKASGAKWQLMSKWNTLSEDAMDDEIRIKHYTDISSFLSTFSQQISYVAIVATGAYIIATTTDITMGALIAITILSNKVFAPIAQLPNIFVQWGRAKVALEDLDNIYKLSQDNEGISRPITHKLHSYDLRVEDLKFGYYENSTVLNVPKLTIKEGEKVAILGVIGSGKSTLLKLLSGLYKPVSGKVFIDNLDMSHISRDILSQSIGYLAQENKLFSGTLRDNLSFGIVGITDERILEVSKTTGLVNLISALPEGLDTMVPEGGESVSGGQKQLIALTRMLIATNDILLLDEPTASMDEGTERHLLSVLKNNVKQEQTMIIVTHKPALLSLVDRVIVLTPQGIAMDDAKEKVLQTLQQNALKQQKGTTNES